MDSAENGVIMKKKCLLPALLFFFIGTFLETDRVVDMRAYSRQRGYRPYQNSVPVRSAVIRRNVPPVIVKNEEDASFIEQEINPEKQEKIRQTGLKIFQKKDENKVMNFNVENPEFRKLNKKQQQDLMNRITFENDESGEL